MESFKSHILVVDDDEGIRSLLKQFLNENGYLVNTASNALEAKEKVSLIKFDLLVLDIMMPGKSGLEFISENKNNLNAPIILLTAKGEASERVEGLTLQITTIYDFNSLMIRPMFIILCIAIVSVLIFGLNKRTKLEYA